MEIIKCNRKNSLSRLFVLMVFLVVCFNSSFSKVVAQDLSQKETCDTLPFIYWQEWWDSEEPIQVKNGYCISSDSSTISYDSKIRDFKLSFDAQLSLTSIIEIRIFDINGTTLHLVINPEEIDLHEETIIQAGNYTEINQIFLETFTISSNDFHNFIFTHQNGTTSLLIDGSLLIESPLVDAIATKSIQFLINEVLFDNLTVEKLTIRPYGQSISGMSDEINLTWIVFDNDGLWKIHPDGTGLEQIAESGWDYKISPDGNFIAFVSESGMNIYDLYKNSLVGNWDKIPVSGDNGQDKWIIPASYCWNYKNNIIIYDAPGSEYELFEVEWSPKKVVNIYETPQFLENSTFQSEQIFEVHCSPNNPAAILRIHDNDYAIRNILYDFTTQDFQVLPTQSEVFWDYLGSKIYINNAELDYPSLVTHVLADESPTTRLIYSPDGTLRYLDMTNFGDFYLEEGSVAPNLQFFTLSDKDRVKIKSKLGEDFQLAEGTTPLWQPNTAITGNIQIDAPKLNNLTATPVSAIVNEDSPPQEILDGGDLQSIGISDTDKKESTLSPGLITTLVFISIGLLLVISAIIIRASLKRPIICRICGESNQAGSVWCKKCHTPIGIDHNPRGLVQPRILKILLIVGAGLLFVGFDILIIQTLTHRPIQLLENEMTSSTGLEGDQEQLPITSIEQTPQSQYQFFQSNPNICAGLNFSQDNLSEVYSKVRISLEEASSSEPNSSNPPCILGRFSYNPDGKTIVMYDASIGPQKDWVVLYDQSNGNVIWTLQFFTSRSIPAIWSPDGKKLGLYSPEFGWRIIAIESGKEISTIPDSSKIDLNSTDIKSLGSNEKIYWAPDGTLIRKVSFAIQIIDVNTGKILSEVYTDDGQMLRVAGTRTEYRQPGEFDWVPGTYSFITVGNELCEDGNSCARLWDTKTGRMLWEQSLDLVEDFNQYSFSVFSSPTGKLVLINDMWHDRFLILDVKNGQIITTIDGVVYEEDITPWLNSGNRLIGYDQSGQILVFDAETGSGKINSTPVSDVEVTILCSMPNDELLVNLKTVGSYSQVPNYWIVSLKSDYWRQFSNRY